MITIGAPRAAAPTADEPDAAIISTLPPSSALTEVTPEAM